MKQSLFESIKYINNIRTLKKSNIDVSKPHKAGVTKTKRETPIIISLTSYPARIESAYKTIRTLLHQSYLPDRIILWLAKEQFVSETALPANLLELKKYGLEIRWCHDILAYKKLVPALKEFPDALIVTVDDDWYYPSNMLEILIEEHDHYPDAIICHAVTHPYLDEKNKIRTNKSNRDYSGTASYFNKVLGGSGALYSKRLLDSEVFNEECFLKEAPTNDDIFFWAMAVKKGTKIRQAQKALGLTFMTDAAMQTENSLDKINSADNLYEKVTNRMLELYPEVLNNLLAEREETNSLM